MKPSNRVVLSVAIAAILAACSSAPPRNESLETARTAVPAVENSSRAGVAAADIANALITGERGGITELTQPAQIIEHNGVRILYIDWSGGASWVSFHHGGGVGIGYSLHAGQVSVADGTDEAAKRLNRVLTNDPGLGVARHVDAGYEEAERTAREKEISIPLL